MKLSSRKIPGYIQSVVSDQRWIHSSELTSGMYVSELDVPWENTTFMFQGFYVETPQQILAVQQQAAYIRVKTEKVARVNTGGYRRMCGATN